MGKQFPFLWYVTFVCPWFRGFFGFGDPQEPCVSILTWSDFGRFIYVLPILGHLHHWFTIYNCFTSIYHRFTILCLLISSPPILACQGLGSLRSVSTEDTMEAPPVRGTIQGTLDDEASIPKACGPWGFHPKLGLNGILLREKLVYDCGTSRCTLLHPGFKSLSNNMSNSMAESY